MPEFDELLNEDPESQVVEVDDDQPVFDPTPTDDDQVVIAEPPIISIGRAERKRAVRKLPEEQRPESSGS